MILSPCWQFYRFVFLPGVCFLVITWLLTARKEFTMRSRIYHNWLSRWKGKSCSYRWEKRRAPFPHLLGGGLTSKGEKNYSQLSFSLERKGRFSLSGNRGIISMGKWKTFFGILGSFCACGLEWLVRYCACFDPFLIVFFSLLDILMNSIRWARHLCHLSCSSLPSNTSRVLRACWSRTTDMPFLSVSQLTKRAWWCKTSKQSNNLYFCV